MNRNSTPTIAIPTFLLGFNPDIAKVQILLYDHGHGDSHLFSVFVSVVDVDDAWFEVDHLQLYSLVNFVVVGVQSFVLIFLIDFGDTIFAFYYKAFAIIYNSCISYLKSTNKCAS